MAYYITDANGNLIKVAGNYGKKPDDFLSETSENAVQNKVVTRALKTKYISLTLSSDLSQNFSTLSLVKFDVVDNQATEYFSYSNSTGAITILKDCKIRASACILFKTNLGTTTRFIVVNRSADETQLNLLCSSQSARASDLTSSKYEILNATSHIISVEAGTIIDLRVQNSYNNTTQVAVNYSYLNVEVIE